MSETGKHTPAPGPWSLRMRPADPEMHQKEYPEQVVDANGKPVVLCCVVMTSGREGEPLANARLITAAPAMLALLTLALGDTEYILSKGFWDEVRTIVAKATGTP